VDAPKYSAPSEADNIPCVWPSSSGFTRFNSQERADAVGPDTATGSVGASVVVGTGAGAGRGAGRGAGTVVVVVVAAAGGRPASGAAGAEETGGAGVGVGRTVSDRHPPSRADRRIAAHVERNR